MSRFFENTSCFHFFHLQLTPTAEVVPPHRTSTAPAELEWHDFGRPAPSSEKKKTKVQTTTKTW